MKKLYRIIFVWSSCFFMMSSCDHIEDINVSPNNAEEVSSNYILTYVLTETSKAYYNLGKEGGNIFSAMQYGQRGDDFNALRVNSYDWSPEPWSNYYEILRNNEIIYRKSVEDEHDFFQGIALVMRSFTFGIITDLYGDCPYSESLGAIDEVYFPKYDEQKFIYKGILEDLRKANELLKNVDAAVHPISPSADVIYQGDPGKWRKFANSLRLRYSMRLDNKRAEMNAIGIDVTEEFKDASTFVFESGGDSAIMEFLGVADYNSAPGGALNSASQGLGNKPCATIVDKLVALEDPRLDRWVLPVLRQWDDSVTEDTPANVVNIYGEPQDVTLVPPIAGNEQPIDYSLYVGLPPGLAGSDALIYNRGGDTNPFEDERSPYISIFHDRYREDANEYVNVKLMTFGEVEFILAEAALKGDFGVVGSAEEHFQNGIQASWDDYGVELATENNDFATYYANPEVNLSSAVDKLERIMSQKWISHWLSIESWFDWRRTGYPDLQTGPVTLYGDELPIRFMYPSPNLDPKYLDNYSAAVNRLEKTPYVPTGQSGDHSYSKMWLLQGSENPW
ncbi:SusD/RagB family nutrient-binding outer membrane lipoprotein [uncultured Kriegella sp.]|uniref:SusD/RagB family nutrient-binding outer membrane lipoprotein n=1 Tax=uncultured Kriegella sp. TaxID=1798910 RepID=UPI0030D77A3E